METRNDLLTPAGIASLDQAVAKWPRRPIRAGQAVASEWLQAAPEIVRGDAVKVDIWSGGAHLELDARAESDGALGGRVAIRNPATQKRFFGQVEGKGRVSAGPAKEMR
jgi:flagella basal body P-ring formation protein FlgA